nr:hypothetical protein [Tanacetum cinerariifolium]
TQRFTIQASSLKALIFNDHFQDSDSDVEEDQRTNDEFMADLNDEYHERALLENQKRFYKRSDREKEKQEKDKIGTKPDKNGERGKACQCRRPITVKKAGKKKKIQVQGTKRCKSYKLY